MRIVYGIVPLALALGTVTVGTVAMPPAAHAQIRFGISVPGFRIGIPGVAVGIYAQEPPPPLPVYDQPPIPEEGYLWTPGYWAYDDSYGYYWVPGTWVEPPEAGYLWTPGYWGWDGGRYGWNAGYWGLQVGYYGGIDYGFGYSGDGYYGGMWDHGVFRYNTAYNHFGGGVHITNVYNRTVINENRGPRVSYNGPGGVNSRPSPEQMAVARERHIAATPMQTRNMDAARSDPSFREAENHGRPAVAAVARPGEFHGEGVVAPREAGERPAGQAVPHGGATEGARPGYGAPEQRAPEQARPEATRPEQAAPAYRPEESRPAPEARPEARPEQAAPAYRPEESRPAPEARSAPEARPAPEERSAPGYRPEQAAPSYRPEAAGPAYRPAPGGAPGGRPAPHPEARPAPGGQGDKHPPQ